MSIYDYDGATHFEIKNVFDNNGNANHQIGKVYDSDGAMNSLVYSSEEVLYDHGVEKVSWTAIGSKSSRATKNADHMGAWTTSYENAGFRTANPIDVSSFSSLIFNFKDEGSGYSGGKFRANLASSAQAGAGDASIASNQFTCDSNKDVGVMQTLIVDISAVDGNYYLAWDVSAPNAKVQVYKIWLE